MSFILKSFILFFNIFLLGESGTGFAPTEIAANSATTADPTTSGHTAGQPETSGASARSEEGGALRCLIDGELEISSVATLSNDDDHEASSAAAAPPPLLVSVRSVFGLKDS